LPENGETMFELYVYWGDAFQRICKLDGFHAARWVEAEPTLQKEV